MIGPSKGNSSPKGRGTLNISVIWAGPVKRGNPAVFNTLKTFIYLNVSLVVRHI